MQFPAPFDKAFLDDLPYEPSVLLLDRIESIDRTERQIVCRMPTDGPLPFTTAQRAHPVKHPRHVSGAVMVHATGMLGFVHVYYFHELRHSEGWIGYGTHIHRAVFRKLASPGTPLMCSCTELKARNLPGKIFTTYAFTYTQDSETVYESKQSAMWMKTE